MIKVNLLPPELKEELAQAKRNAATLALFKKSLGLLVLGLLLSISAYFLFSYNLKTVANKLNQEEEKVKQYGTLEEKSKKIAERINTIKSINGKIDHWSGVVEEIQKIIPSGVYLTQVKMDANPKNRNQLAGSSKTKKDVATLRDAMENSEKFEFVDIESSTTIYDPITKAEKENFTLTFALSKEALDE